MNKEAIIKFMTEMGTYKPADEFIIDRMFEHFSIAKKAYEDLLERGIIVHINREKTVSNSNPANNIYLSNQKEAFVLYRKLGLDPRSRNELKLSDESKKDDYDS